MVKNNNKEKNNYNIFGRNHKKNLTLDVSLTFWKIFKYNNKNNNNDNNEKSNKREKKNKNNNINTLKRPRP